MVQTKAIIPTSTQNALKLSSAPWEPGPRAKAQVGVLGCQAPRRWVQGVTAPDLLSAFSLVQALRMLSLKKMYGSLLNFGGRGAFSRLVSTKWMSIKWVTRLNEDRWVSTKWRWSPRMYSNQLHPCDWSHWKYEQLPWRWTAHFRQGNLAMTPIRQRKLQPRRAVRWNRRREANQCTFRKVQ